MYYLIPLTIVLWLVRVVPRAIAESRTRVVFGVAAATLILPYGSVGAFNVGLSWAPFGYALGYAVLGYVVISAGPPRRSISLALFFGATAGLVVAEQLIGYNQWEMSYPGPLVFAQTIALIGLVRSVSIPDRWHGTIARAAKLTFGVYLLHLIFVQGFMITLYTWPVPDILMLVISWLATVTLSFAMVAGWHRIRGLERILG
jgi:surface polysaccharide O-acyltransferase-like enzyme